MVLFFLLAPVLGFFCRAGVPPYGGGFKLRVALAQFKSARQVRVRQVRRFLYEECSVSASLGGERGPLQGPVHRLVRGEQGGTARPGYEPGDLVVVGAF